jgi:tRNA(Ile)-lysidine synthetase-like protein
VVWGRWRISASQVTGYDQDDASRAEVVYLDASRGPYWVRAVREGDMIRPLGLGGSKKVLRAMMDRKVPSDLRRRTPVVVGGDGEVAWIPLGDLGEGFKVGRKDGEDTQAGGGKDLVKMSSMMPDVQEVLIPSAEIGEKVREMGARISEDYRGRETLLVGILRGAVVVMSDLMRNIDLQCEIDFMDISSYGTGTSFERRRSAS